MLTDLDLTALLRAHEERGARATLGLYPVEDSSAYGLVQQRRERRGPRVPREARRGGAGEVNAGMYVLERSVLDLIPPGEEVSIERDVFPRLVGDGLYGLRLDGYWMDIGTPERYLEASWDILEGRVETRVAPTAPGHAGRRRARGRRSAATVGPRAVLGPGCRVEAGAEVRDSVLLDGCLVGEGARVTARSLPPASRSSRRHG